MKVKYKPKGRGRRSTMLWAGSEYELLREFTNASGEHCVALCVATDSNGATTEAVVSAENVEFPDDPAPILTTQRLSSYNQHQGGVANTLEQRKHTHGNFTHVADTTQSMLALAHTTPNWNKLTNTQKEALHMSFSKIARILNGDPNHPDNWHDIAGYATLAEQAL